MRETQPRDRTIAKYAINTLNNDRLKVLDLYRRGSGTHAQMQNAVLATAARENEAFRPNLTA